MRRLWTAMAAVTMALFLAPGVASATSAGYHGPPMGGTTWKLVYTLTGQPTAKDTVAFVSTNPETGNTGTVTATGATPGSGDWEIVSGGIDGNGKVFFGISSGGCSYGFGGAYHEGEKKFGGTSGIGKGTAEDECGHITGLSVLKDGSPTGG
jgi:hypothetical protein